MDHTEDRQERRRGESEGMPVPLETFGGGGDGCSCGCCGPTDTAEASEPADREQEIAELKELREATVQRLAELDAE